MNMRKGFALVELLAVIAVIAVMSIAFAALINPLFIEIPKANRLIEVNAGVLNMLSHLRDDVEAAVRLPDSLGDKQADANNLLIELPDNVVCYTLESGKVVREVLNGGEVDRQSEIWSVPRAGIDWRRWQKDGRSYAVEIGTHIEYEQGSRRQYKLANSYVYFIGASAEVVREK
jgi:prepilin-type N-terminal cleavage/methylation domain-containing protein